MADSAFQTMYRQKTIDGFEKDQSVARHTVVTEYEVNGNEAVFLVADSGSAEAVTRGINGLIPSRPDNLNQYTCTLQEWHDKPKRTGFNIYASQGDGMDIMRKTTMAVMNRKIDKLIEAALSAATTTWNSGTGAQATLPLILKSRATLATNSAVKGQDIFAQITPGYLAEMYELAQFTSRDYIQDERFEGLNKDQAFVWHGINWIVNEDLDGVGTSNAKCYMYAKNAIGHGCNLESLKTNVGYNDEDDYSFALTSMYMGSKLLQNSGVIVMNHDDTNMIIS